MIQDLTRLTTGEYLKEEGTRTRTYHRGCIRSRVLSSALEDQRSRGNKGSKFTIVNKTVL